MGRVLANLLVVIVLCAGASPHGAAPAHALSWPIRMAADDGGVDLAEAIRRVKARFGDVTVLKAETRTRGERSEHRIRILTPDGRVMDVRVDASTGEME